MVLVSENIHSSLKKLILLLHQQTVILGRQIHRAVRRGLHPTEAGLQPRAHHHPQVAAERNPRSTGQAPVAGSTQTGRYCTS